MQFYMQTLKLFLKIHNHTSHTWYQLYWAGEQKGLENIRHNNLTLLTCFIINEYKEHYFKEPRQFAHFSATSSPKKSSLQKKRLLYSHPVCNAIPRTGICWSYILLILIPIQEFFYMQTHLNTWKYFQCLFRWV